MPRKSNLIHIVSLYCCPFFPQVLNLCFHILKIWDHTNHRWCKHLKYLCCNNKFLKWNIEPDIFCSFSSVFSSPQFLLWWHHHLSLAPTVMKQAEKLKSWKVEKGWRMNESVCWVLIPEFLTHKLTGELKFVIVELLSWLTIALEWDKRISQAEEGKKKVISFWKYYSFFQSLLCGLLVERAVYHIIICIIIILIFIIGS